MQKGNLLLVAAKLLLAIILLLNSGERIHLNQQGLIQGDLSCHSGVWSWFIRLTSVC